MMKAATNLMAAGKSDFKKRASALLRLAAVYFGATTLAVTVFFVWVIRPLLGG